MKTAINNALQTVVTHVQTMRKSKFSARIYTAREAIRQRYKGNVPEEIVWEKDLEMENHGLKPYKSKEWLTQRLYLAQLGVYAAERIAQVRKHLIWITLALALFSCSSSNLI